MIYERGLLEDCTVANVGYIAFPFIFLFSNASSVVSLIICFNVWGYIDRGPQTKRLELHQCNNSGRYEREKTRSSSRS